MYCLSIRKASLTSVLLITKYEVMLNVRGTLERIKKNV